MDIAKYMATAILLSSLFNDSNEWGWFMYLVVILIIVLTLGIGLLIIKEKKEI